MKVKKENEKSAIRARRIPPQHLNVRLLHRELHLKPWNNQGTSRVFYQNIAPNFTLTNIQKPPCFLRKFSPDGRFLVAFSSDQMSLEIFRYMGSSAAADLLHSFEASSMPPPGTGRDNNPSLDNVRKEIFDRFFSQKHYVFVAANGEQLNRECSLFTDDGRYVIVGSASSVEDTSSLDHFEMFSYNEAVTPNPRLPLEDYTLYIVDLELGRLSDIRSFKHDKIFLSHNQGLYLYRRTLAVLSVQHQNVHIFQISPEGQFVDVRTIGRVCYDDDDYLLSATLPERRQPNFRHFRDKTISSLKHRFLVHLFRQAESISVAEGSPRAVREFYHYFDHLLHLRMWKMQLLDENHLLIKYASEDVVTLRAQEPNCQPSFFVVYNMASARVLAVYENTSSKLLQLFEQLTDFFRNARLSCESQFTCSPSNNTWARLIHRRFKETIVSARGGGLAEATKRILGTVPISSQSYSASPYLDLSLFSYDDKWVSGLERPKSCADHPIKFYGRDSGILKFSIHAGRVTAPLNAPSSARRLVAFTFHPVDPFLISVQRANTDYVVNFHVRHLPC